MEPEKLVKQDEATIMLELEKTQGWRRLFRPWLQQERIDKVEMAARLISEDAPKNKFSVLSGEMKMIDKIFEQVEAWKKP